MNEIKKLNSCKLTIFTLCHTKTLCTTAAPQKTIPIPMRTAVTMAPGLSNSRYVYRMMPAFQIGEKKMGA